MGDITVCIAGGSDSIAFTVSDYSMALSAFRSMVKQEISEDFSFLDGNNAIISKSSEGQKKLTDFKDDKDKIQISIKTKTKETKETEKLLKNKQNKDNKPKQSDAMNLIVDEDKNNQNTGQIIIKPLGVTSLNGEELIKLFNKIGGLTRGICIDNNNLKLEQAPINLFNLDGNKVELGEYQGSDYHFELLKSKTQIENMKYGFYDFQIAAAVKEINFDLGLGVTVETQQNNKQNTTSSSIYGEYYFPKGSIFVKKALTVKKDIIDELYRNQITLSTVESFYKDYGHIIGIQCIVGGKLHSYESLQTTDIQNQAILKIQVDFETNFKYSCASFSGAAKIEHQSENKNEQHNLAKSISVSVLGGNEGYIGSDNQNKWVDSTNDPSLWKVIKIQRCELTTSFLPVDLQEKFRELSNLIQLCKLDKNGDFKKILLMSMGQRASVKSLEINLNNNKIEDITPLSNLKELINLKNLTIDLRYNKIEDITPLSHLKEMKALTSLEIYLQGNYIKDHTLKELKEQFKEQSSFVKNLLIF